MNENLNLIYTLGCLSPSSGIHYDQIRGYTIGKAQTSVGPVKKSSLFTKAEIFSSFKKRPRFSAGPKVEILP